MSLKSLENLLKTSSDKGLGEVIERAQDMGDLVQILQKSLPPEEGSGIAAANIHEDGELVVLATSSAWAARLRYEAATLLAAAQNSGRQVERCSVRVMRD